MKLIDLTGRVFGRLTVIRRAESRSGQTRWACRCECGTEKVVQASNLTSAHVSSCGCWRHNLTKTPTYRSWAAMVSRCHNRRNSNYPRYGGRGVIVCPRWRRSFLEFLRDVGPRPSLGHSIDRYPDNAGGYEPGNCRWATRSEQRKNQRPGTRGRLITYAGRCLSVRGWAAATGISGSTIGHRLRAGWPVEVALTAPVAADKSRGGRASQKSQRRAKPFSS